MNTESLDSGHQHESLHECVAHALEQYFHNLDGQPTNDLYQLVLSEVEAPLLEAVLAYTRNNQSKSAEMLGLNRGTLRKKLKQYNLL
ncbi:MAG: DNA-binding transcriptional regulator Fis [Gammaproteobacteria bacterium]|nr:MAG: DNA-binding transcriptional regulator Fis [Gammaproteobacteria bacterium]